MSSTESGRFNSEIAECEKSLNSRNFEFGANSIRSKRKQPENEPSPITSTDAGSVSDRNRAPQQSMSDHSVQTERPISRNFEFAPKVRLANLPQPSKT
jgi:hypothetical protein